MKASPAPTSTADRDSAAAATPFHPLTGLVQTMPLQVLPMRGALEPDAVAIDFQYTEWELFPRTICLVVSLLLTLKADFVLVENLLIGLEANFSDLEKGFS